MCHSHVFFQFYSSDLLVLACHMRVRLLMLHLSQSRLLHVSQTLCVLHVSKISCVKSGVLHRNKTWQVQSYSTLLYCMVILVYQIPVSLIHYSTGLLSLTFDILHHGLNMCTAMCTKKVLIEIIILKALENTIANSSILLVTSIPIHHSNHCITPTEQQKRERQQDMN